MSHHGQDPIGPDGGNEGHKKLFEKLLNTASFRGATGQFPEGKLTPSDEGQIQFALGERDGKVVIEFGTPVAWVGMGPQQAADLASGLLKWARVASRKSGEPLTFTVG